MEIFLRFPGGRAKVLTFSYDDGVSADIRLIEIFRKNGMKGTFNLNSNMFGHVSKRRRLTIEEALEVYTPDVCEVACHSANHPLLTDYDPINVWNEVYEDRKNLENIFGRQIHGMAYPFGNRYSGDTVVQILKNAGIYYSRSCVATKGFDMSTDWLRLPTTCHHNAANLMELAESFLTVNTSRMPKVFFVWGHSYEFDEADNWHVIEEFCEKLGHKDDIWYATNIELYYAWLDFSRLEISADRKSIHNPSCRSVWIGSAGNSTWEIKPGETLTF